LSARTRPPRASRPYDRALDHAIAGSAGSRETGIELARRTPHDPVLLPLASPADDIEASRRTASSGAGLDAAARKPIVDAFLTTKPDGVGMGPRVSRAIVEAHGGRIQADLGPLAGATVSFTIPSPAGPQHLARLC
jgi:nitrogen-specific signal transduction histidine kinase